MAPRVARALPAVVRLDRGALPSCPGEKRTQCRRPKEYRHLIPANELPTSELRSWMLHEPQIERREHQDNSDVHYQPLPEPVPEEQDVHADHDGYQREHVKHDGCLSSHPSFLLRAAEQDHNLS